MLAHGLWEEPEDLVQEALRRTLAGTRRCPQRMEIVAFLNGVIRSLASNARRQGQALRTVPLDEDALAQRPAGPGTRERTRAARRRLLALFAEGSADRRVVELMLEGRRGASLRAAMGYTPKQLATVRRRIRRRVERAGRSGMS